MASNTRKLKVKRDSRRRNMGKERKRINRSQGTTPAFAVHVEETGQQAADGNESKE